MTADINTNITLKGTTKDLMAMIKVIKENKYLSGHMINGKSMGDISNDELELLIKDSDNKISMSALGPYGRFLSLPDTKIFEEIAHAAPNASFTGISKGFQGSSDVKLLAELKNKKLHLNYSYTTDDECGYDKYIEYVNRLLSKEEFCKLFKIDEDELDEDDYEDFLTSEYLDLIELNEFKEYFPYSNIDKQEFKEAQNKYKELRIDDYNTFVIERAEKNSKQWVYNPLDELITVQTEAEKHARKISPKPEKIEFEGKIFVHTYCGDGLSYSITKRGGIVKSSVVLNTDYIIIGDYIGCDPTDKIKRAIELNKTKEKNIKALTLSEYEELLK